MNKLAIFDCDGTLVDSGGNIFAALSDAFGEHSVVVPPQEVSRRVIGLSLVEAIATLVPDEEPERHVLLAESYKRHFQRARAEGRVEEPLFAGIAELLDVLEADGWLLAVATGKSDRGLSLCLDCHGYAARFISLQTADRHPSKPHPSMVNQAMADAGAAPETTVVIGDTAFDMAMAVAAGATGIGAAWGYHEADEDLWRRRFQVFMLVRLFGVATFFGGIAVIYTDLLRDGGWPTVGAILAIMGALDSAFAPRLLKKIWAEQDSGRRARRQAAEDARSRAIARPDARTR